MDKNCSNNAMEFAAPRKEEKAVLEWEIIGTILRTIMVGKGYRRTVKCILTQSRCNKAFGNCFPRILSRDSTNVYNHSRCAITCQVELWSGTFHVEYPTPRGSHLQFTGSMYRMLLAMCHDS